MMGKRIITVRGMVETSSCKNVLSHEHLFIDLTNQAAKGASSSPLQACHREQLMKDPYSMRENLLLDEFSLAEEELKELQTLDCNVVVECSLPEIGRDAEKLKTLSERTHTHIVMGCGFYTEDTHPEMVERSSAEELAEYLLHEIRYGVGSSHILPGIIGEIGTGKEVLPNEKKALLAAALAQKATSLAVQVHIYPWAPNGLLAAKLLMENGVIPEKIVICHSDVEPDLPYIRELLHMGVYVQFDNFGKEFVPEKGSFAGGDFIKDFQRVDLAALLIKEGFASQLLLTNDICLKCMLKKYGGNGYSHIFRNIIPALAGKGVSEKDLALLCRENPLRMLAV